MMRIRVFLLLLIPFLISAAPQRQSPGQGTEDRRSQGPVLIRDFEEPGEGEEKVYPHDPEQARKNLEIGKYYFKRDNYAAAEDRFSEAVKYDRTWPEAYKKLLETYEKLEKYESAVETCRSFAENNPESGDLDYFSKAEISYQEKFDQQSAEGPE
jgi:tetratricopeptide (TPR) repeat protein